MEKVKENFYSYKRTYKSDTDAVLHQSFAQSRPAGELLWTESTIVNNSDKNKPRKKITIIVCYEKMYDYYPDDNVAADISYLLQKVKKTPRKQRKKWKVQLLNLSRLRR
ncbi:hypothetical protein FACS18942_08300 [Planctomycetales bacterium]|nr:hypothetical protein FACS18942_08300 [Planctomycetales bacterium]